MAKNPWFEFKQFRVEQHNTALRVGTDGVLIGAWCAIKENCSVLDIGTGTGLITLMVAQRGAQKVDAIEIDSGAFRDAEMNFLRSRWSDRLSVHHDDFRLWSQNHPDKSYDLIVSNPPFFVNSLKSGNLPSDLARHTDQLSFENLLDGVVRLLKSNGIFSLILPFDQLEEFRELARLRRLFLRRMTQVIPREGKKAKRVLLEFTPEPCYPEYDILLLLDRNGHPDASFIGLTKDFYLAF